MLPRLLTATAFALLLTGCTPPPDTAQQSPEAGQSSPEAEAGTTLAEVTIIATVPDGAGDIYLAGNLDSLGPWRADGALMSGEGRERRLTLSVPDGMTLEFKITGGAWENEGVGPSGTVLPNFTHRADASQSAELRVEIVDFKHPAEEYLADPEGSGVLGTLIYWLDTPSAFFDVTRHVEIWLPPGYADDPERRYPVIYMHDGQNLFDPRIANTGNDWGIDEAMMRNVEAGLHGPAIVVGIWSTNIRGYELSPWHGGPDYARMIIEEIMPRVNAEFRTLTDRGNTFTMGSSMGGLISQYLVRSHPEVFSACGCVSTHVPLSPAQAEEFLGLDPGNPEDPAVPYIVADARNGVALPDDIRMYFDYGTVTLDEGYGAIMEELRPWLEAQGLVEGTSYAFREFEGAPHNEAAWRARVDLQLAFMLGGIDPNSR